MEITLAQLFVSLVALSGLLAPTKVEAEIQPWSMPTEAVQVALNDTRLNVPSLLWEIGRCESRHNVMAKNKYSSASGEYQFIKSSWKKYGTELWGDEWVNKNIFSKDNEELAVYVFNKYGTRDWNESKKCWSPVDG